MITCVLFFFIDGYGLFPYFKYDLLFIPQLFYKEIILPLGIQSTQLHINYWDDKYFDNFKNFIKKNEKKIINLDYIIDITNPNNLQKITNYLVEKTLKTAFKVGQLIASNKGIVVCGGLSGIMESVCKGAKSKKDKEAE